MKGEMVLLLAQEIWSKMRNESCSYQKLNCQDKPSASIYVHIQVIFHFFCSFLVFCLLFSPFPYKLYRAGTSRGQNTNNTGKQCLAIPSYSLKNIQFYALINLSF